MKNKSLIVLLAFGVTAGCAHKTQTAPAATTGTNGVVPVTAPATDKKEAVAQANKPTSIDIFVCSRDSDVRELYIEPLTPSGCKLWYSNHKTGNPIASSVKGLSHCETVNENIRKNLETAGYKCGAVNNTAKK